MKQSKRIAMFITLIVVALVLSSCYAKVVVLQEAPKVSVETTVAPSTKEEKKIESADGTALRTGLSFVTGTTSSKSATAEANGTAQSDATLVAVAVDENGVIDSCIIDAVQAKVSFNNKGELVGDISSPILSKNELGPLYGMAKASSIGKEWNEQMASLASYVVGKTAEEVNGIAFSSGKAEDVDLSSSVTVYIGGFIDAIVSAADNAVYRGAKKGDTLDLVINTVATSSKAASSEGNGVAQADITVALLTRDGDTITSAYIDAVQPKVAFDVDGNIVGELSSSVATKNELKEGYGMSKFSSLGADWYKQAASYCDYITGKKVSEILGIALNERTAPAEADLSSSVTMAIGDFQNLIKKVQL